MAYRDEHDALRARLEATEQRLRLAEHDLAEAKRRLDEPLAMAPTSARRPPRRTGFPPAAAHAVPYGRVAAALFGTILQLVGIASLLWNVPGADGLADIAATLAAAVVFCLAPGGLLLFFSARRPPQQVRVGRIVDLPRARVHVRPRPDVGESVRHAGHEEELDTREVLGRKLSR